MAEETKTAEAELVTALQELEGQTALDGPAVAKGFRALGAWMVDLVKGAKKPKFQPNPEDEDEKDGDEDEDEPEDEDETGDGAEDEEEGEDDDVDALLRKYGVTGDEDEGKKAPRKVKKGLDAHEALTEDLPELLEADQVIGGLIKGFERVLEDRDRTQRREVRQLRKSIEAQNAQVQTLVNVLGQITQHPVANRPSAGVERIIEKGVTPGVVQYPEPAAAIAQANAAVRKGLITAQESRAVELAYQVGRPGDAANVLARIKGVEA